MDADKVTIENEKNNTPESSIRSDPALESENVTPESSINSGQTIPDSSIDNENNRTEDEEDEDESLERDQLLILHNGRIVKFDSVIELPREQMNTNNNDDDDDDEEESPPPLCSNKSKECKVLRELYGKLLIALAASLTIAMITLIKTLEPVTSEATKNITEVIKKSIE